MSSAKRHAEDNLGSTVAMTCLIGIVATSIFLFHFVTTGPARRPHHPTKADAMTAAKQVSDAINAYAAETHATPAAATAAGVADLHTIGVTKNLTIATVGAITTVYAGANTKASHHCVLVVGSDAAAVLVSSCQ